MAAVAARVCTLNCNSPSRPWIYRGLLGEHQNNKNPQDTTIQISSKSTLDRLITRHALARPPPSARATADMDRACYQNGKSPCADRVRCGRAEREATYRYMPAGPPLRAAGCHSAF